jgi:hypothetical protein
MVGAVPEFPGSIPRLGATALGPTPIRSLGAVARRRGLTLVCRYNMGPGISFVFSEIHPKSLPLNDLACISSPAPISMG